jgi:hypothetical protein
MKIVKKISDGRLLVAFLCSGVFFLSCTKDYTNINTNKNSIATVGPAELPFLFSKAQSVATNNQVNYQIAQNLFADQYAQYFACNATYFPSDRLVIRQDWVGAAFNPMYTDALPQLQIILTSTDSLTAEHALAEVWWVFTFHRVTDYWGPIPYFKAGTTATSVPYDPQDKIYDDFFKRLSAAVAVLKTQTGKSVFGSYDLIYGGDVSKWIKFASTLRLRLAMRISAADPVRARTEGEAAIADGLLTTSPGDDALVQRSTKANDGNGLSVMSDWNEFRMSASMASVLNGYQDPRLPAYFLPAANSGTYQGLRNGLTANQLGQSPANSASANSHVGPRWASTTFPGGLSTYLASPQNVMATAESYFLRAEASLLGWNVGGLTTQQLYEGGIKASMNQWGITDPTVINNYVNSLAIPVAPGDYLNSPPMTNIPVKFSAIPSVQKEQIATQKWLSLFPDGMEAWADYRRSHVLKLYPVANSDNPDITNTSTQWIRRIPFLDTEKETNGPAVTAAVSLLGGPDKVTTPLWWDKN